MGARWGSVSEKGSGKCEPGSWRVPVSFSAERCLLSNSLHCAVSLCTLKSKLYCKISSIWITKVKSKKKTKSKKPNVSKP